MIPSRVGLVISLKKAPNLTLYELSFEKGQEIFLTFVALEPFGAC